MCHLVGWFLIEIYPKVVRIYQPGQFVTKTDKIAGLVV